MQNAKYSNIQPIIIMPRIQMSEGLAEAIKGKSITNLSCFAFIVKEFCFNYLKL